MRTTLVIPSLLALLACQPKPADPQALEPLDPVGEPAIEPDGGKPVVDASEVKLSPTEKNVTVPVGTNLLYAFRSHGSVGLGASQTIADPAVVKYVRTDTEYEQSEAERQGKPGSDAATGTFVFHAVAAGTTTVTVDELMQGTTKLSTTFTITVTGS